MSQVRAGGQELRHPKPLQRGCGVSIKRLERSGSGEWGGMSFFAARLTPSEDRLDDPAEGALHFLRAFLCCRRRQHESGSKSRGVVRHGLWGYLFG